MEKAPPKGKIKQSETATVKRSTIKFAEYNPRKADRKVIDALIKNFKKVGYLGGVIINKLTMNIVGGHQRTKALDEIHNYPEKDYDIKVEFVELTDKQEKEQNIFLNNKRVQGETDYEAMAKLIPEIDFTAAGLNDIDLDYINTLVPQNIDFGSTSTLKDAINELNPPKVPLSKEAVKEAKKNAKANSMQVQQATHLTLTWKTYEEKCEFMASIGIAEDTKILTSEAFLKAMQ